MVIGGNVAVSSNHPALNADGYRLIARSLGRSLAYIMSEQGVQVIPWTFRTAVDALCADLAADNPRFDSARFWNVIEAARLSEEE